MTKKSTSGPSSNARNVNSNQRKMIIPTISVLNNTEMTAEYNCLVQLHTAANVLILANQYCSSPEIFEAVMCQINKNILCVKTIDETEELSLRPDLFFQELKTNVRLHDINYLEL